LSDKFSVVHTRAPMRLSFGGGGTELAPYVNLFGGAVLSAAISMYAYVTISRNNSLDGKLRVEDQAEGVFIDLSLDDDWEIEKIESVFKLAVATTQEFKRQLGANSFANLHIITGSDAPISSGLGASSVLTIALNHAMNSFFSINFSKQNLIDSSYHIERVKLGLSGGLQDHYPAVYGGMNFIEFAKDGSARLESIKLKKDFLSELESSLLLINTGTSRNGAEIIEDQTSRIGSKDEVITESFHELKRTAYLMKKAIETQDVKLLGKLLDYAWSIKKTTSTKITNSEIENLYSKALDFGAMGGKLSGAGGGGFLLLIVPPEKKIRISRMLTGGNVSTFPVTFVNDGATTSNNSLH